MTFARLFTRAIPVLPEQASSFHIVQHRNTAVAALTDSPEPCSRRFFFLCPLSGMRIIHTEMLALVPSYLELKGQLCQQCLRSGPTLC